MADVLLCPGRDHCIDSGPELSAVLLLSDYRQMSRSVLQHEQGVEHSEGPQAATAELLCRQEQYTMKATVVLRINTCM